MQKIANINLGGMVFQIEEQAFEKLQNYLKTVKKSFQNQENGKEIAQDIEQRMAEMLNDKIDKRFDCVQILHINEVIQIMGNPSQFGDLPVSENPYEKAEPKAVFAHQKKFFRDTDSRILGGVSGGIAAYFGIASWIIRLVFLISIFFGGLGFIFYILLWIAVPKAKNASDKLAMKGEPATIESIVAQVEKTANELQQGKFANILRGLVTLAKKILFGFLRLFRKFFGFLFLIISFFLFLFLLAGFNFGSSANFSLNGNMIGVSQIIQTIYNQPFDIRILKFSTISLLFFPVFSLFGLGLWLIGRKMQLNKAVLFSCFAIWAVAFFVSLFYVFKIKNEFSEDAKNAQTISLVEINQGVLKIEPFESEQNIGDKKLDFSFLNNAFILADSGLYVSNLELIIEPSLEQKVNLIYEASANGNSVGDAQNNIKNIVYRFSMLNNTLLLDDYLKIKKDALWRNQKVKLRLQIPDGQKFVLDDFINRFTLNIDQVLSSDSELIQENIRGKILILENGKLVASER